MDSCSSQALHNMLRNEQIQNYVYYRYHLNQYSLFYLMVVVMQKPFCGLKAGYPLSFRAANLALGFNRSTVILHFPLALSL
jgi:hypothetical protein